MQHMPYQAIALKRLLYKLFRTILLFLFWRLITIIPERFALGLAPRLGSVIRKGTQEQIIRTMKRILSFQHWSDKEWSNLWRSHATHVGLMLIELIHLHNLPIREVQQRISIEGKHHLDQALKSHRGVMLFVSHLGNMACVVGGLAINGYDVTLTGKRQGIPYLERKLKQIHQRVGAHRVHIGHQLPFTATKIFSRNGVFATFIDFSVSRKHTVGIKFGHAKMRVNLGPAIIALRNNVEVLCASCLRMPGNRHRVIIHSPLECSITGDAYTDATSLMQQAMHVVEAELFERPEQWWPWDKAHLELQEEPSQQPFPAMRLGKAVEL